MTGRRTLFLVAVLVFASCRGAGVPVRPDVEVPQAREADPPGEVSGTRTPADPSGIAALRAAIDRIRAQHAADRATIEAARTSALAAEQQAERVRASRAGGPAVDIALPDGGVAWVATAGLRQRVTAALLAPVQRWEERVRGASAALDPIRRAAFAADVTSVLAEWSGDVDPVAVRDAVRTSLPAIRESIAWLATGDERRAFLARIADQLASTPGHTDLQDLEEMIGWAGMLHARQTSTHAHLRALTADLVVVLTERDVSGLLASGLAWYRPGRFLDSGFAAAVQDGSDQVRHFVWALRLLSVSKDLDATEPLLALKEVRDALLRRVPVEQADLELNRRVRRVVEAMLGIADGVAVEARAPLAPEELGPVVHRLLSR